MMDIAMRFKSLLLLPLFLFGNTVGQAQERLWNYDQTESDAFLVFGVPGADDLGMSFWCTLGSGKVRVYFPLRDVKLKDNKKAVLKLKTDGASFDRTGKTIVEKNSAATGIQVEISIHDAFFKSLMDSPRLTLSYLDHQAIFPTQGADIDGLLQLCQKSKETKAPSPDADKSAPPSSDKLR